MHWPCTQRPNCLLAQVDIKNRKHFLRRTRYEELRPELLYLGNNVTVFARSLKLLDFGDDYTRRQLEDKQEK